MRIIVILFVIQSMALCIESLPVIIMYQSFGCSYVWIICWISKWIFLTLLLYHTWKICQGFTKNFNDPLIIKKCQMGIKLNGLTVFLLFCVVSVVSIWCEGYNTKITLWFTIISCITGFFSGAVVEYMYYILCSISKIMYHNQDIIK